MLRVGARVLNDLEFTHGEYEMDGVQGKKKIESRKKYRRNNIWQEKKVAKK